jgi:hypothetical protein
LTTVGRRGGGGGKYRWAPTPTSEAAVGGVHRRRGGGRWVGGEINKHLLQCARQPLEVFATTVGVDGSAHAGGEGEEEVRATVHGSHWPVPDEEELRRGDRGVGGWAW